MTVKGVVRGGVVVLENSANLRDGTEVTIEIPSPPTADPGVDAAAVLTLYERVRDFVGIADGLPQDMAENHDHYVHGRPKKS
jgi:hypothetical protein